MCVWVNAYTVHVSPPRVCTLALWYLAAVGNGKVSNFVHNWLQEIVIKAKDFLSNHYPPFSWDGEQNVRAYVCEMEEFFVILELCHVQQ